MKMKRIDETKALNEIKRAFSHERQAGLNRGRGYSQKARELALSSVRAGQAPVRVAEAAGISSQSLINWRHERRKRTQGPLPVELALVDSPRPADIARGDLENETEQKIRICFRSGASMELAVSRLDARLIAALNLGAS